MKFAAIVSFAVVVVVASTTAQYTESQESFQLWRSKFQVAYVDEAETSHAYDVWTANLRLVNAHNAREERGEETYRMGMNRHADMTNEEYRAFRLRPRENADHQMTASFQTLLPSNASVPDSVDWVKKGVVTKVKDQGNCGSCWAFSAVAAMEGAYNYANQQSNTIDPSCTSKCGPAGGPNVTCCSFSEQEVADCTLDGKDTCKIGGEPHDGILDVVSRGGKIATESAFPYVSGKTGKLTRCSLPSSGLITTGITGYTNITSGDEDALAAAVAQHAVISVGIDASSFGFQLYDSGIYTDSDCHNTPAKLDHGVAVVGYGAGQPEPPGPTPPPPGPEHCMHDFHKQQCVKEQGCHWCVDKSNFGYCFNEPCPSGVASAPVVKGSGAYWMVKNSWGQDWGMGGYIAMAKDQKNMCGIATDAVFAVVGKQ